ncbi:MAG: hypothetical protein JWM86_364 [Thermoleophilia bacterium]|nr:hypothetical protein [Thermoleophilia bacterium]
MGAEEYDIVARVTRAGAGSSSTGALAAHLARACGHVQVDARVIQLGYRFHAELGDEIPAFFNRRMSTGSTNIGVTLQAGFDPEAEARVRGPFTGEQQSWSIDPFEGCRSTADARAVIEADDYHASVWLARLTIGFELFEVRDIAEPLFIAKHPNEFRAIAEELVALGVVQAHACPLCSDDEDS